MKNKSSLMCEKVFRVKKNHTGYVLYIKYDTEQRMIPKYSKINR